MKDITATKQFWLYVEQELKQMAWQDKFNKMTKKELRAKLATAIRALSEIAFSDGSAMSEDAICFINIAVEALDDIKGFKHAN